VILQTIICGVEGCAEKYTERKYNEGFPGWGHVAGLKNDETGETICHVCPKHLAVIKKILSGELRYGMD